MVTPPNATPQQIIANLTLMNNKFMNKVFDGNIPAAQLLLRIILKDDKIMVDEVSIQHFIQNLYGHSAQLDILATDADGRKFNVEVQRSDDGAPAKRARFYSSTLDTFFLQEGNKYHEFKDIYVIFITENDVLGEGRPVYNIARRIIESNHNFNDGSYIIYVNASYQDNTPIGKLMHDFNCADPDKMYYPELAKRVKFFKKTKDGERNMTDIIEIYAEQQAEKRACERVSAIAAKLLAEGESIEKTAHITDLPLEEVRALATKIKTA